MLVVLYDWAHFNRCFAMFSEIKTVEYSLFKLSLVTLTLSL